jgi:cytochrome c5
VKRLRTTVLLIAVLASCINFVAQCRAQSSQGSVQPSKTDSKTSNMAAKTDGPEEGERLFHAHCGSCHELPDDLSPREARAVVRQMRVRAMLTAKDERIILQYLAP